jgi:hypothetical protein
MLNKKTFTLFIIAMLCIPLLTAFVPTVKATTTGSFGLNTYTGVADGQATASNFTSPYTCRVDNITVQFWSDNATYVYYTAVGIYDVSGNLIAASNVQNQNYSIFRTWYTYFFSEPPVLTNGTTYLFAFFSNAVEGHSINLATQTLNDTYRFFGLGVIFSGTVPSSIFTTSVLSGKGINLMIYYTEGLTTFTLKSNIPLDYTFDGNKQIANRSYLTSAGSHTVIIPSSPRYYHQYSFLHWEDGSLFTTRAITLSDGETGEKTVTYIDTTSASDIENKGNFIAYTNTSYAVRWQGKTVYAQGRYWIFYVDKVGSYGFNYFTSSINGLNWTEPEYLKMYQIEYLGENLQVLYNSSLNIMWVFSRGVYYRAGIPYSNGTISWLQDSATVAFLVQGQNVDFYAELDSSGYPWVTYGSGPINANMSTFALRSDRNDGVWNTEFNLTINGIDELIPYDNTNNIIVPLSNRQMYFFTYGCETGLPIRGKIYNGSALGELETIGYGAYDDYLPSREGYARSHVVDSNDNIYFAYVNNTHTLKAVKREYATGWGTESIIQNTVVQGASPSLSLYNDKLYLYWINSSTSIYYKVFENGVWDTYPTYATINLNPIIPLNDYAAGKSGRLNGFSQTFNGIMALLFVTNSSITNIYEVKLFLLSPPLLPEEATSVEIITLASPSSFHFLSESLTANGVTAYGIKEDYGNDYESLSYSVSSGSYVQFGFRVYLVTDAETEVELTTGQPQGIIYLFGSNISTTTGYWICPEIRTSQEALKIQVFMRTASTEWGEWIAITSFISDVLLVDFERATWQFTLDAVFTSENEISLSFGSWEHDSEVANVGLISIGESRVQWFRLSHNDLIGFLAGGYVDVIGEAFYVFILLGIAASLYKRFGHLGPIAFFFTIFGGVGGIIWVFVPLWAAAVVSVFLILICTFIVWRLIR